MKKSIVKLPRYKAYLLGMLFHSIYDECLSRKDIDEAREIQKELGIKHLIGISEPQNDEVECNVILINQKNSTTIADYYKQIREKDIEIYEILMKEKSLDNEKREKFLYDNLIQPIVINAIEYLGIDFNEKNESDILKAATKGEHSFTLTENYCFDDLNSLPTYYVKREFNIGNEKSISVFYPQIKSEIIRMEYQSDGLIKNMIFRDIYGFSLSEYEKGSSQYPWYAFFIEDDTHVLAKDTNKIVFPAEDETKGIVHKSCRMLPYKSNHFTVVECLDCKELGEIRSGDFLHKSGKVTRLDKLCTEVHKKK